MFQTREVVADVVSYAVEVSLGRLDRVVTSQSSAIIGVDGALLVKASLEVSHYLFIVAIVLDPAVQERLGVRIPDGISEVRKLVGACEVWIGVHSCSKLTPESRPLHQVSLELR